MKKCSNCGAILSEEARFCHICGSAVIEPACEEPKADEPVFVRKNSEPDERSSSFVINEPVIKRATTDEERQSLLDKMRSKLRGERALWLIAAILSIVLLVSLWFGYITSFVYFALDDPYSDEYYDSEYDDVFVSEIVFVVMMFGAIFGEYVFIPTAVFGFIMAARSRKCLKTLYRDCSYTYRRCSSASVIVFSVIFNPLTLIFTIPLFRLARSKSDLLKEIAEIQYNYYNYYPDATKNY